MIDNIHQLTPPNSLLLARGWVLNKFLFDNFCLNNDINSIIWSTMDSKKFGFFNQATNTFIVLEDEQDFKKLMLAVLA